MNEKLSLEVNYLKWKNKIEEWNKAQVPHENFLKHWCAYKESPTIL